MKREARWVWRRPATKLWAHIFLHKRHPDFDLVPILIGRGGAQQMPSFASVGTALGI